MLVSPSLDLPFSWAMGEGRCEVRSLASGQSPGCCLAVQARWARYAPDTLQSL